MAKRTKRNIEAIGAKRTEKEKGYSSDGEKVVFRFDKIDRTGKFAFDIGRKDFSHKLVLDKIISYSSMTWTEIKRQTHDGGKSKNHMLDPDSISAEVMERIKERGLEEYSDAIFSFALQNKIRIVGYRENQFFYVLWYDPNHEICPSTLKHT